jgi:hypothetical protein
MPVADHRRRLRRAKQSLDRLAVNRGFSTLNSRITEEPESAGRGGTRPAGGPQRSTLAGRLSINKMDSTEQNTDAPSLDRITHGFLRLVPLNEMHFTM